MKLTTAVVCSLLPGAVGFPGMEDALTEIRKRGETESSDLAELIGDLEWLSDRELTPVGARIRNIILGLESGESGEIYFNVPNGSSYACTQDTCCVWWYIVDDMEHFFRGPSGRCTNSARAAIRLAAHDAFGWSKFTGTRGGADGSIVLNREEITHPLNRGLKEIIQQMRVWFGRWRGYVISMADLIQMASTVATVVCPLGPRVRSFVGRHDSDMACPDGLLPDVFSDADTLIELFQDKAIHPVGLAALIGAHSTSQQRFVDRSRYGDRQDSTPGIWDVKYYEETLGRAPPRVFKFPSDIALAEDPRINKEFRAFAGAGGQQHWNKDYAREYVRLSLLGVYNINNLTDCTWVLPQARRQFGGVQDQWAVDMWTNTTENIPEVAKALEEGKPITRFVSHIQEKVGPIFAKVKHVFKA